MNQPLKRMKGDFKENCTLLSSSCHAGGPWLFVSWMMMMSISPPVLCALAEEALKGHNCCKGNGAARMLVKAQSIRIQQSIRGGGGHCPGAEFRT